MRNLGRSITLWVQALLLAFQWLTVLPLKRIPYSEAGVKRSLVFYPLVGWVIGGVLIFASAVLVFLFPPLVAGILLLAVWVGMTGALHLDGFMDAADGLLSHRSPERMLEIMRDSRVGAWGVIACCMLLLVKGSILVYLAEIISGGFDAARLQAWLMLATIPMLSRSFIVWAVIGWPYARSHGFGTPLREAGRTEAIGSLVVTSLCLVASLALFGAGHVSSLTAVALLLVLAAGAGFGSAEYISRKLGGLTGDVYGAVNEWIECLLLLAAAGIFHVYLFK